MTIIITAGLVPGEDFRVDEAELHGGKVAGEAAERAGQHVARQLVAEDGKTERLHAVLIHLDADQRPAEGRAEHAAQQQEDGQHQDQHQPVEVLDLFQVGQGEAADRQRRLVVDVDAVGTAAVLAVVEEEEQHLREGQRHHDEEDAFRPQHQQAGDQREQGAHRHRRRQRPPQAGGLVLRPEQGQRIAGQAEIGGMAEAHQAGIADEEIEAHGEDRQDHHLDEELHVEGAADQREQRQQQRGGEEDGERLARIRHLRPSRTGRPGARPAPPPSARR
jgi:hypothetical protein